MGLLTGTAAYCQRFRPGLPDGVPELLDAAAPDRRPGRLLDFGTGTAILVAALRGRGLSFVLGRAEELEPAAGWQDGLVTICRAFHWIDQPALLARLAEQVAPGGAVALVNPAAAVWEATAPWMVAAREMIR